MRLLVLLLSILALAGPAACTAGTESDSPGSEVHRSGVPTPTPWAPSMPEPDTVPLAGAPDAATAAAAFHTLRIAGGRPFLTPSDYLNWLASRPGTGSARAEAVAGGAGAWEVRITVTATDGRVAQETCPFVEGGVLAEQGALWAACPQAGRLWTVFGPTAFDSLAEGSRFLPRATMVIALPDPLPAGFTETGMELPEPGEQAERNLFVLTLVYRFSDGTEVRVAQQPAGLNTAVFPAWQQCAADRWPQPGRCVAWAHRGAYVVVWSDTASLDTLHAFARAIDPSRP